ncbi:unnamed protein product [Cuscuta epithymum]|uniref:EF-hand domain-containing protein n=1 Tax=Cuscuta epithymum TaxID=186058 RepID=A0AAV0FFT0_9ASTE|nr:unnamed protein product [Cuscuta epithymum]
MASYGYGGRESFSPSAPPLPAATDEPQLSHPYHPAPSTSSLHPPTNYSVPSYAPTTYSVPSYAPPPPSSQPHLQSSSSYGPSPSYGYDSHIAFPRGTHPDVIRSFQMVDSDRSGFVEDKELQQALASGYQKFSLRTVRLLIFLFKNPNESSLRIGPKEFAALWSYLGQWRETFERFDRDRSGRIDGRELRDALYSLGYLVPSPVLQLLVSKYDGDSAGLEFDSFVECGMIFKIKSVCKVIIPKAAYWKCALLICGVGKKCPRPV